MYRESGNRYTTTQPRPGESTPRDHAARGRATLALPRESCQALQRSELARTDAANGVSTRVGDAQRRSTTHDPRVRRARSPRPPCADPSEGRPSPPDAHRRRRPNRARQRPRRHAHDGDGSSRDSVRRRIAIGGRKSSLASARDLARARERCRAPNLRRSPPTARVCTRSARAIRGTRDTKTRTPLPRLREYAR